MAGADAFNAAAAHGDAYLIVDDHVLIREGIVRVFAQVRPRASLFEASSLREAIDILQGPHGRSINTLLLDLNLPDSRGIETLRRVRAVAPDLLVGVVSGTDDDHLAMQCLQSGAAAFVPKHGDKDQLVQSISALASGGVYFPRELLWRAANSAPATADHDGDAATRASVPLTRRQSEVLRLLLKGFSNATISHELGISAETVKLHVSALLRAYKVASRVHLILACGGGGGA